jgi:hypothetical protein
MRSLWIYTKVFTVISALFIGGLAIGYVWTGGVTDHLPKLGATAGLLYVIGAVLSLASAKRAPDPSGSVKP